MEGDEPEVADALFETDRLRELSLVRIPEGDSWVVQDGRSRQVDAKTWAILTGNADVLGEIEARRKKGRVFGWALVGGGGILAAASAIPLFTLEDALAANEATPGFDELGTRNDARVAAAFSMLGSGILLAGTGLVSHAIADKRANDLTAHLDAAAADAAIATYNGRLDEALTPTPVEERDPDAEDIGPDEDLEPAP